MQWGNKTSFCYLNYTTRPIVQWVGGSAHIFERDGSVSLYVFLIPDAVVHQRRHSATLELLDILRIRTIALPNY